MNSYLKNLAALILCLLPLISMGRNDAFWSTVKFSYDANRFLFSAEDQVAFDDTTTSNEFLALAGYEFTEYFSAYVGHRIYSEQLYGRRMRLEEHRPTLELHFTVPEFMMLKLDFRTRFELRDKKSGQPYMRYRQRVRLRTSWNITQFKLSPYIHEEVFFSDKPGADDADIYDRNRVQMGISLLPIPKCPNLGCNLYFMLQHDLEDKWRVSNTYGIDFSYKF